MKKLQKISALLLASFLTFMEMTAWPAVNFINIEAKDVTPIYFSLMANFIIAFAICFLWKITLGRDWKFGFTTKYLWQDLKDYGWSALLVTVFVILGFCLGLHPFDYTPSATKVLIEGIIYYIFLAIMEELYLRGLLQNALEKAFSHRSDAKMCAILLTSFLFGIGHAFGALDQPPFVVIAKIIWAMALGAYFGGIYVKTRNIWIPILTHMLIDWGGIPFCFTTKSVYPNVSLCICLALYFMLGTHGILVAGMKHNMDS